MKKVLLINGHQRYEGIAEGRLNRTLIETAAEVLGVMAHKTKTTVVEAGYDVGKEVERFAWADAVIVQVPVYWMSVPYIFKKYIDEVFSAGLAQGVLGRDDGRTRKDPTRKYGSGGLMQGRRYVISTTWNAPLEALEDPAQFFEGRGVDGVFMWLHKAFQFLGMEPLPSFSCHDVMKAPDIENDLARFRRHIEEAFKG